MDDKSVFMGETRKQTILVVDDNRVNLMLMQRMLEHCGAGVVSAENGPRAIEIARETDLALILLDVQMPGMDGFETAREIKGLETARHTPIIFVTAISQEREHVQQGYDVGAVDYLFKPVDPNTLLKKVQVFLELNQQKMELEREIALRTQSETALRQAEEKYRNIFENAVEGIFQASLDGRFIEVNPALARIFGYETPAELMDTVTDIGAQIFDDPEEMARFVDTLRRKGSVAKFEYRGRRRGGKPFWISMSARLVTGPENQPLYIEGVLDDVSERKASELDLQRKATYDVLTNIPNRFLFFDRLNQAVIRAKRFGHKLAILFVDLDLFKAVNDTYGHLAGDILLKEVAERLSERVRESDTLARLGGDEFGVILPQIEMAESAAIVARDIVDSLKRPFHVLGRDVTIGASVGLSLYPADGSHPDELLTKADAAMYLAKKSGGNAFVFADPDQAQG